MKSEYHRFSPITTKTDTQATHTQTRTQHNLLLWFLPKSHKGEEGKKKIKRKVFKSISGSFFFPFCPFLNIWKELGVVSASHKDTGDISKLKE